MKKKFNILLTQEDTVSLAGKGYIEAQINFKIGVLESKYDTDISSELASQLDELVEYTIQLDLLDLEYSIE